MAVKFNNMEIFAKLCHTTLKSQGVASYRGNLYVFFLDQMRLNKNEDAEAYRVYNLLMQQFKEEAPPQVMSNFRVYDSLKIDAGLIEKAPEGHHYMIIRPEGTNIDKTFNLPRYFFKSFDDVIEALNKEQNRISEGILKAPSVRRYLSCQ